MKIFFGCEQRQTSNTESLGVRSLLTADSRIEIRIIKDTEENQPLIAELWTLSDDLCLFKGDDYTMLTNYGTAVRCGDIEDCLPNHSF